MRHADAEETRAVRDHDRPVTRLGRRTAADVARQLRAAGWLPDVLVCSNAVRSRQTLEEMRRELGVDDADEHYLGSLYSISQLDGQTRAHLQVGHSMGVLPPQR
jgi:phosphohistidine phosphatase SixA